MKQALLEVNNLVVNFTADGVQTNAVKGISFQVEAGKMLAIVGESGSGKSVTSLAMMGLLPKQATVQGELILHLPNKAPINLLQLQKRDWRTLRGNQIAMIFQEPMTSLNPVFTCGEQVMEAIQLHQSIGKAAARQKTIQLFERVRLPDPEGMIKRYPHQLSGGQKQRVMIAMAISCNPALLIADEPTTALDVTVQQTILELIKELQLQNSMSVLFITHDLGLVADMADAVAVMYKGEIIEQGTTAAVLNNPNHEYTKALLNCRPALHQPGHRLPVAGETAAIDTTTIQKNIPSTAGLNDKQAAPVLKVENLKVHYLSTKQWFKTTPPPFKAVDDVSFTVHKGETVGLVGESGCGKTTLGRAILQLIPATSGKIILNDIDLLQLSKKEMTALRKDLQIVFQDPYGSLNPRISIGDAIMEPMQIHGLADSKQERKSKVIELLEKVNLQADHFHRYPHQFSGGQRQRICIARALALQPSFLIFDESVSALDVSVQAQVLNLLNDLKAAFQFSAIFISHDLSVVKYISDRILVMRQGKIIEEGTAANIYSNPQQAYTRQLIKAIPGKQLTTK